MKKIIANQTEFEKILHKHANKLDIHEKQNHLNDRAITFLEKCRQEQEIKITTIQNDQAHAADFIKSIATSLDKFTDKFELGINNVILEIGKLKENNKSSELIKHLIIAALCGIGGYLLNKIGK